MEVTLNNDYIRYFDENPLISPDVLEGILKRIEGNEILFVIFNNICKLNAVYYKEDTKSSKKTTIRKNLLIVISEFLNKAYDILDDCYMYQLVYFLVNTFEEQGSGNSKSNLMLMCLPEYFTKIMKDEIVKELL